MRLRYLMSVLLAQSLAALIHAQIGYQPPLPLGSPQVPHSYQPPLPKPQESVSYVAPYVVPEGALQSISSAVQSGPHTLSAERTYSTNTVIHKAPASEIESGKDSGAKDKAAPKEEYVVYYYYYYDNDTNPNSNLSLNFDDIPNLESYDDAKDDAKAVPGPLGNAVDDKNGSSSSQARSLSAGVADAVIRADQPPKPVSNVFRYGSNEVPRFPVLPSFVASEVAMVAEDPTTRAQTDPPTTTLPQTEDDSLNSVLDNTPDPRASAVEDATTTTTTEPTTTEIETTTTEKPRRRPPIGGGRRRPTSGFTSNRSRPPPSSTPSTTSTTTAAPTRRSFQGSSRLRPRPPSRTGSRTTEASDDRSPESSTATTSTQSSRSRFTSASPRRFQASRSRSQTSSSTTTTTTRVPPSPTPARSRPTSRPRPNLISRNRPARPGFLRPRPEPEEPETTTPEPEAPSTEATEPVATDEEEESEETSTEEPEEPTTTESNRFSALFRPRNRNALGNRPRPVIGNRPSRS